MKRKKILIVTLLAMALIGILFRTPIAHYLVFPNDSGILVFLDVLLIIAPTVFLVWFVYKDGDLHEFVGWAIALSVISLIISIIIAPVFHLSLHTRGAEDTEYVVVMGCNYTINAILLRIETWLVDEKDTKEVRYYFSVKIRKVFGNGLIVIGCLSCLFANAIANMLEAPFDVFAGKFWLDFFLFLLPIVVVGAFAFGHRNSFALMSLGLSAVISIVLFISSFIAASRGYIELTGGALVSAVGLSYIVSGILLFIETNEEKKWQVSK